MNNMDLHSKSQSLRNNVIMILLMKPTIYIKDL